jgi:hypothetical protein
MTEKAQKTYNRKTKSRLEASESFLEGVTFWPIKGGRRVFTSTCTQAKVASIWLSGDSSALTWWLGTLPRNRLWPSFGLEPFLINFQAHLTYPTCFAAVLNPWPAGSCFLEWSFDVSLFPEHLLLKPLATHFIVNNSMNLVMLASSLNI